jgi:hypothetical protein
MPPKSRTKPGAKPLPQTSAKAVAAAQTVPAQAPAPPVPPSAPVAAAPATVPTALEQPDAIVTYQALYDILGRAYWEASDLPSKDTIQGARDAIYDILTDLNIAKLKANTALYLALIPRIKHSNETLQQIQKDIGSITKNITTAASVVSAITKVLNIAAMF